MDGLQSLRDEIVVEIQKEENQKFFNFLEEVLKEAANKPPMMSLDINEQSSSIELFLDTKSGSFYGEWIKGEGGDICLYRDQETNKVVGCHLPLYQTNLIVTHTKKDGSYETLCEPKK